VVLGAEAPAFNHPPVLDAYPADLTARIPWLALLPAVFLQQVLLGSSLGEEPGWRGYALPRMQWMHSSLSASLLLGLLWALWHLPLWIRPEQQLSQVAWDTLGIIAAAVLFTWVFNHSRGSLLLALLFHASIAVTGLFLAVPDRHAAISTVLAWLLVGLVLRLDRQGFDVAPPDN